MEITLDLNVFEMARLGLWLLSKTAPFFRTGPPKLRTKFNSVAQKS